jgi:predicted nucleotidyltransferase
MSSRRETDEGPESIEKTNDVTTHAGSERQIEAAQIIRALKVHLPHILQGRPVLLAYAYGSLTAGCMTPFSDVDIALVLSPGNELDAYQQFMLELEIGAELETRCGIRDADVRSINRAPLRVQGQVLTRGVLLYSKDEDFRVNYEVVTRKRYFDFQPTLTLMRQAYFARLETELREKGLYE